MKKAVSYSVQERSARELADWVVEYNKEHGTKWGIGMVDVYSNGSVYDEPVIWAITYAGRIMGEMISIDEYKEWVLEETANLIATADYWLHEVINGLMEDDPVYPEEFTAECLELNYINK